MADGRVFRLGSVTPVGPELAAVDVAPAVPEVANPGFSSNTTLAGGSDLYVANRGNGTIMRWARTARWWRCARSRCRAWACSAPSD